MKKILFLPLLLTALLFGQTYSTSQAAAHIGEYATVCGVVSGGYYAKSSRGKPTFINLDGKYPNQAFTVVIWGEHRAQFGTPEKQYKNRKICVKGTIDTYRNIPQIEVESPGQIR